MEDLAFITGLMKEDYNALGFIPYEGVTRYLSQGRYLIQKGNGKPVGYLLHSVPKPFGVLKIAQTCIDYDWREKGYGHDVLAQLEKKALEKYCGTISLRCAVDLQSNNFWLANGYKLIRTLPPATARSRAINVYQKVLIAGLFDEIETHP